MHSRFKYLFIPSAKYSNYRNDNALLQFHCNSEAVVGITMPPLKAGFKIDSSKLKHNKINIPKVVSYLTLK